MLYSEFITGTGCKDSEYNYKVYKDLEVMYMNSNLSKSEIYEYGKKLVDNSKSEAELKIEAKVKAEIEEHKAEIEQYQRWITENESKVRYWKSQEDGDEELIKFYRNPIKHWKQEIRYHRNKINSLKQMFGC